MDALAAVGLLVFGFLADSLTLIADAVRGNLAFLVEVYAWVTGRSESNQKLYKVPQRRALDFLLGLNGSVAQVMDGPAGVDFQSADE